MKQNFGVHVPFATMAILLIAGVFSFAPGSALGSNALRSELKRISEQVDKILAARQEAKVIAIGAFSGPATFPTSSGPGVAQILKEELEARGIQVRRRAEFGLSGNFSLAELQVPSVANPAVNDNFLAVRVTVRMADAFGASLAVFAANGRQPAPSTSFDVRDEETITQLVGLTGSVDPSAGPPQRNQQLREQVESESAGDLRGTELFADAQSPYGVEILVNKASRPIRFEEGLAFVPLKREETYTVRLINRSKFDAAVALTIDGLSSFTFSKQRRADGSTALTHYLVPAGRAIDVEGWFVDATEIKQFLVTSVEQGAGAELQQTADVGVITARFHAAWRADGPRPPDEPGGIRGTGNATGLGDTVSQTSVVVPRLIGAFRSSVSIRYSRPEL